MRPGFGLAYEQYNLVEYKQGVQRRTMSLDADEPVGARPQIWLLRIRMARSPEQRADSSRLLSYYAGAFPSQGSSSPNEEQ